jgi:hypothetical protein
VVIVGVNLWFEYGQMGRKVKIPLALVARGNGVMGYFKKG